MPDKMRTILAALDADTVKPYPEVRALKAMLTRVGQFETGAVTGTGAALDVATSGDPKVVIVVNTNTGTWGLKINGMATTNAVKMNSTGPAITYAANMITLDTNLFTIGNDAQLNTAHTLVWAAII